MPWSTGEPSPRHRDRGPVPQAGHRAVVGRGAGRPEGSGQAAVLTPVGIGLAGELGIDPVTILALTGTCVSFTLLNPFSHQSNLMVMRPGGYTTATFGRFGAPLFVGVLVTACAVAYALVET